MTRRLHIVRHAPVIVEPNVPSADWQLRPGAAALVTDMLANVSICSPSRVISSSQDKAIQTAEVLAKRFNIETEIRDGFEEHHREDEPFISSDAEFRRKLRTFFSEPDRLVYGSETAKEALARFQTAVDALMSAGADEEIVVTHGTIAALFLATRGGDAFEIWSGLSTPDYRCVPWR